MSLSMAVLGEPMEIVGLRRRVREEFGTEMGQQLMEALGEMARARYVRIVSLHFRTNVSHFGKPIFIFQIRNRFGCFGNNPCD